MLVDIGFPDTDAPVIGLPLLLSFTKFAKLKRIKLFYLFFVVLQLIEEELWRFSPFRTNYQKLLNKGDQHGAVPIFMYFLHLLN
jgi:hypothetical protein